MNIPFIENIKLNSVNKSLVENFFSLQLIQVANYLLPLVTVPYLVRVLGPEKYGLIAFAQALIQYFVIFTDYGFNFSVTRKISIVRSDKEAILKIFSSVYAIKSALLIISLIILAMIVSTIPKFREYWFVYLFTFGTVLGNVFFPIWLFLGTERMKYISILNIFAKTLFTIAIFIFVRCQADYVYVPIINSASLIAVGLMSIWVVTKKYGMKLKFPSLNIITEELKDGWRIFIPSMTISLYTSSITFILGIFTNNTVVGYYSAAEKLVNVVQGMLNPATQAIYPFISRLAHESKEEALKFIKQTGLLLRSVALLISIIIFFFARHIVFIVLGSQYQQSIVILRILAFIPLIVGTATIYANFFLLGFGYTKEWSRVILTGGGVGIFCSFLFIYALSLAQVGAAVTWVITECCVLTMSYLSYRRLKLCL